MWDSRLHYKIYFNDKIDSRLNVFTQINGVTTRHTAKKDRIIDEYNAKLTELVTNRMEIMTKPWNKTTKANRYRTKLRTRNKNKLKNYIYNTIYLCKRSPLKRGCEDRCNGIWEGVLHVGVRFAEAVVFAGGFTYCSR